MMKGIDISVYQGDINWEKVKGNIDFAIIRAGYGKGNVDKKFKQNITACNKLGIPCGVYWFSYALNEEMAKAEADYCINLIKPYKIDYPVCFDYEYDSYNYAKKNGPTPNANTLMLIAKAFLDRVEKLGYYSMNYTNPDFLSRGFSKLTDRFDTWLAQWGVSTPTKACGIWQYSATGAVPGIVGNVDMDISYNDYPTIIKNLSLNKGEENPTPIPDKYESYNQMAKDYYQTAVDVIEGKYSTNTERENLLKQAGYDPYIVQKIVNFILK